MTDTFQALRDLLANGVGSSNAKQPKKQTGPPHQGPTHLERGEETIAFEVEGLTDGTTTEVVVVDPLHPGFAGRGVSRRRKGDPRNSDVGYTIALARALRDMANKVEADLR